MLIQRMAETVLGVKEQNAAEPTCDSAQEKPFDNAQDRLQHLRLEELALLHQALEQTRDALTGAPSRAKAAALLKGKPKCNTNEFDRWVMNIWNELTPESCKQAQEHFPDLMLALKSDVVKD